MSRVRRRSAVLPPRRPKERREKEVLMERIRRDAERLAIHFGLQYKEIVPESANVRRRYGICYDDGCIAIRLKHVRSGELLKYSSLVNTLCHELAHLRHFNHGPRFKDFYFRILDYARREGIYRPGTIPQGRWIQMSLFGTHPNLE